MIIIPGNAGTTFEKNFNRMKSGAFCVEVLSEKGDFNDTWIPVRR